MPKLTEITFEAIVSFSFPKLELDDETLNVNDIVGELVKIKTGQYENRYYGSIESVQNIKEEVREVGQDELSDESIMEMFEDEEDEEQDPEETSHDAP